MLPFYVFAFWLRAMFEPLATWPGIEQVPSALEGITLGHVSTIIILYKIASLP